jgi:ABC-type multidrug transport system ATPase subunit
MRVRGLSKHYPGTGAVLDDIDVDITSGELVAIIGGNGSGKTTLLKILVGLSRASAGTVSGRPPVVAYVPERFPSQHRMSALAYLTHMGRIRGLSGQAAAARARELLERLALVGGETTELRRLSKGNAQKVALAQAILVPAQLLVLDEPWTGLDTAAHEVLTQLMNEVATAGGAVVFTDHHDSVVAASASVIYEIREGHLSLAEYVTGPAASPAARIELVTPHNCSQPPDDLDWETLSGVLDVTQCNGAVTITVVDSECDALLLTAIRNGWSVQDARRSTAPHRWARQGQR